MAVTPNYGWPIPVATDYVKDGYDAIADLGNAIDTTVAALPSGSLELIQTQTLTASSGISFTSLAVGTYYKLKFKGVTSSNNTTIQMRFRENSTDKATVYAGMCRGLYYNGGSADFNFDGNGTAINAVVVGSSQGGTFEANLLIEDLSSAYVDISSVTLYSPRIQHIGYINESMSNCNGLSLFPSTGTITGAVSLYKFNV